MRRVIEWVMPLALLLAAIAMAYASGVRDGKQAGIQCRPSQESGRIVAEWRQLL